MAAGVLSESFKLYQGGQSLTSGYRNPANCRARTTTRSASAIRVRGQVQLAGAPAVSIRRFVFGDLPAGSECRTVSSAAADLVPGVEAGRCACSRATPCTAASTPRATSTRTRIQLVAGITYRFELKGVASRSGTLVEPVLVLHDASLSQVALQRRRRHRRCGHQLHPECNRHLPPGSAGRRLGHGQLRADLERRGARDELR